MLLNIVCHLWLARRENATHRSLQSSLRQYRGSLQLTQNLPGELHEQLLYACLLPLLP